MIFPRLSSRSLAAVVLAALLAACAQQPAQRAEEPSATDADAQPAIESIVAASVQAEPAADLPKQELTDQVLYEFLLAEIAGQRGNIVLAAQAYAELAKRTRDPRIARRAYEVALAARMPDAATMAAQALLEAEPNSPDALRRVASLLVSTNRIDEAQPYLQRILSLEPANRGEGFMQLNRLLAGNRDKAANLRVVQELAQPYPDLPQAHFAVAQAAAQAEQDDLALAEIRQAGKLQPEWELPALFEAQLLQRTSNAAARERLESYLKTYPKSRDVRLNYARVLVADKMYPEARTQFETLLKDNPTSTDVLFAVAVLSMQLEDYAGAEGYLKRLLDLNYRDRDTVRLYLGQISEEQKRFPEALEWYRTITGGEHYLPAQIRQAQVMSKQGDLPGARQFLHKVNAQTNQQRVQLIIAESQLLRDANQPKEAFDVVGSGLDKLPNDPDLLYDYAMLAEKLDRMDILESSLRKLIRLRPEHAHAYNALGYSLADRNERLPEAKELIEKALKLSPDDSFIIDSLGWVYYRMGNNEEALKLLRRAYAGRPDAEIAAHLGEVLWVSGNKDEAQKVWSDATMKAPSNDTLLKTIQRFKP